MVCLGFNVAPECAQSGADVRIVNDAETLRLGEGIEKYPSTNPEFSGDVFAIRRAGWSLVDNGSRLVI